MFFENSPNVKYINNIDINKWCATDPFSSTARIYDDSVIVIDLSTASGLPYVLDMFDKYKQEGYTYPVSRSGLSNLEDNQVGSTRLCTNSQVLANYIDNAIRNSDALPQMYGKYKYEGVSSYFRFMKYEKGGMHYPHYDSDYVYQVSKNHITKMSMVMYFTDCDTGEIAFINDKTAHSQDRSDWERQATDNEIWLKVKPKAGRIVIFPHTLCHSVLEYKEDFCRVMVRGDLIYSKE